MELSIINSVIDNGISSIIDNMTKFIDQHYDRTIINGLFRLLVERMLEREDVSANTLYDFMCCVYQSPKFSYLVTIKDFIIDERLVNESKILILKDFECFVGTMCE